MTQSMSGSYPLQLQGEPTCPRGWSACTQKGTIEEPSKLSNLSEKLSRQSSESRGELEPGGPAEKEAESGSQPLVIDKTKEIHRGTT